MRQILALIFLLSLGVQFTGVPVLMHYCSMSTGISTEMCKECQPKVVKKSCCEEEPAEEDESPVSIEKNCCQNRIVLSPSDFDALIPATEAHHLVKVYQTTANLPVIELPLQLYAYTTPVTTDYSHLHPPEKNLYLRFSNLLI